MTILDYDVAIIGGGPGGYVTAIRSAQLGFKTVIIEREHIGGICLNWGCIPTKALLRSAEIYRNTKNADEFGISVKGLEFDIHKIVERSRGAAQQLSAGVEYLLKKNRVDVIAGHGKLAGKGIITIEKEMNVSQDLSARHIILATGARPRSLPGIETDGKMIWNYKHAMVPDDLPNSILVIGSGAIGIEFASFYHSLGVEVTVVEVLSNILPAEDEEISALAQQIFEKDGLKILTSSSLKSLKKGSGNVTALIENEKNLIEITVDRVIMAVGISGNHEQLGLENTQIKVNKNHVVIDEWSWTGEPGVYAIGDLAGPPWLAHKASHEGIVCIEKIAGQNEVKPLNVLHIPGCTYGHPQIASVGLTERVAKEKGFDVKVGKFPFAGNGKAMTLGEPEGLIKTVFNIKTGELLGAHMLGAEVTELIQGYVIGMSLETTEIELMETVFPHPTLSEMMHESVLDAYGKVIHF
ncbi:dihydrolipoyl dehydrogenase [Gammaproteobacteria bacterium]|nr:dihydrolipoyl dehydrogenase [Gammaproteobacteria bacterium]